MVERPITLIILDQIWKPVNTRILLCVSHINSCTASMGKIAWIKSLHISLQLHASQPFPPLVWPSCSHECG